MSKLNCEYSIAKEEFYGVWNNLLRIAVKIKEPNGLLPEVWRIEREVCKVEMNSYSEGYSHDIRVWVPDVDNEVPVIIITEDYHKGCKVTWQGRIGTTAKILGYIDILKEVDD